MSARLRAVWVLLAAGCGPAIQGGMTVPAGQEPRGRLVRPYAVEGCEDGSGGEVEWGSALFVVYTGERWSLVETRPGYDSLVVSGAAAEDSDLVFRVVVGDTLREVRVPAAGGPGAMVVASSWEGTRMTRVAVRCRLRPLAA